MSTEISSIANEFFFIADVIGIIAAALGGYIIGVDKKLDIFGVSVCAFSTALGGGIIRDVIAGVAPFSFTKLYPFLTVAIVLLFAMVFRLHKKGEIEQTMLFIVADAVGVVAFAVAGTLLAIKSGFNIFGVVMLGFIGAIGGGIIRDVIINEMPKFMFTDFYATVAVICAFLIYLANLFGILEPIVLIGIAMFCIFLRIYAYKKRWKLKRFT